ncbi:uncharacterized protein LOC113207301 [Frankliniella occidentalis]|uniref:Uncharacterized protein LOC113207301 n=1 Tax=Frankliniella occidentalis TaxID=133901 RepID=A0A9C6U991_FRAOC|nr:uncharacterized protein LOC113207301 [Frankliniella occidentalis]XP_052125634.1 uncharacterized protein LOC113207301 [Frankliniella occidentalis]
MMSLLLFLCTLGATLTVSQSGYAPGCKEYLKTCLDQLPAILSQHELKGIPTSLQELDTACHAFTTGMTCVDNFTRNCLEKDKQKWVENTVAGAKATFSMLCKNKAFRDQYLKYSSCFLKSSVNEGWDHCAGRFIGLVQEEMARNSSRHEERIMELCCARHGFLKCVYGLAKHKCGTSSAVFLRSIAETLSSVRVESKVCRLVSYAQCSGSARTAQRTAPPAAWLGLIAGLALYRVYQL